MEHPRLLIVDDELLIRDLLYDYFSSRDFLISTADSGEKAMELLAEGKQFDAILTDIKMPGMDGLELIEHLKKQNKDLPIIIITGFPSLDTAIEALRKRVYDYVIKPFNINRLYIAVEAASKEYQEGRRLKEGTVDAD